jgi:glyoxylase-like metal-dependent hydrolase (beta-lactamase superfamily II)
MDRGTGPPVVVGVPVELARGVHRLTAPNPSMMTGPGTNTYLLGDQRLLVLDPGPDDATHRAAIVEAVDGREVLMVAVTHHHPDHAPGAASLAAVLGAPTAGAGHPPAFEPQRVLRDGERIDVGGGLRVIATPGHASDHLCFLLDEQGIAFTGDHVMQGSTVVIRPPDGDLGHYLSSLERLKGLSPRLLAPGHGRLVAEPTAAIEEIVAHRREREDLVRLALMAHGPASASGLRRQVYPELDAERHDIAAATLLAHLLHLAAQGLASCEAEPVTVTSPFRSAEGRPQGTRRSS